MAFILGKIRDEWGAERVKEMRRQDVIGPRGKRGSVHKEAARKQKKKKKHLSFREALMCVSRKKIYLEGYEKTGGEGPSKYKGRN